MAFCERVGSHLGSGNDRGEADLLNLLVDRIVVGEDTLEVHHFIPLTNGPSSKGEVVRRIESPDGVARQRCRPRSGMAQVPLDGRVDPGR